MSEGAEVLVQTLCSEALKINDVITTTLDEKITHQRNTVEDIEHANNEGHYSKNVKHSKRKEHKDNKSKQKHKTKLKGTKNGIQNEVPLDEAVGEETEQNASSENELDKAENHRQSIKTNSSRHKKKLTKKLHDVDLEIEDVKQKLKPKFRLSLNSEVKNKHKFKEDSNQGTIKSFFQKLLPKPQDNHKNIQKDEENHTESKSSCFVEELEENCLIKSNLGKETENLTVNKHNGPNCIKNIKESIQNKSNLFNENDDDNNSRRKKKSLELAGEKSSRNRSKKSPKEKSTRNGTSCKKEKVGSSTNKILTTSSKVEEPVDVNNIEEELESDEQNQKEHLNDKEHKKVRFSEDIKEFSPERVNSHKGGAAKKQLDDENKKQPVDNADIAELTENIEVVQNTKINNDEDSSGSSHGKTENTDKNTQQLKSKLRNAFIFMMDGRHKSIGQNSPGKEQEKLDGSPELYKENKKKLSSRKAIFEEWANTKGAKKRKLEDEEKGIVIENKLKKRAKRLKKMLTKGESPDITSVEDSQDKGEISAKKHKITRIIESDSEYTCDSDVVLPLEEPEESTIFEEKPNPRKEKRKRKSEKNLKEDPIDDALDEEKMFLQGKKRKLSLFSDSSNSESNMISENKRKNDLKKSPSSTPLQQTELSSFFGILNKAEVANKTKSKLRLKQNLNNFEHNSKTLKSKKKKNNVKSKLALKKNDNSNTADGFLSSHEDPNSTESEEEKIKSDVLGESTKKEPLAVLTPSSIKQWKMKLRVSLANVADEEIEKLIQSPKPKTESEDDSEDVQKMGKKIKEAIVSSGSDSESDNEPLSSKKYNNESKNIKPVKLAPLFIKAKPKPKMDEATIEARRKFLHSGIPDSLKKVIEKQQRVEELDYQIFPTVSHVTVKPTPKQLTSSHINLWALPKVELQLTNYEAYSPNISLLNLGAVTSSTALNNVEINLHVQKITNIKNHLNQLKIENPNYPVYKAFKSLHHKYLQNHEKEIPKLIKSETVAKKSKRGRPKKKKPDEVQIETPPKAPTSKQEIWTDLYKPNASGEIFGNYASISQFKTWLETWLEFSEEINLQRSKRKRSDSSDFENTDADSKDGTRLPGNTVIFSGPHGSGKTTAVYALCNELGINVLELNASSKRTGKRLLQELQEATRSHQVRKNDSNPLTTFLKREESKTPSENSQSSDSSTSSKKMCLLLIEDVDVVFEQDENFITALGQLLTTSKRPVVLTTTDINCLHLRKFVAQHSVIGFSTLSAKILGTWLQVLCLIEGLRVDRQAIVELLEWNEGDVRRTLLQLQFWVQSGGEFKTSKEPFLEMKRNASKRFSSDENLCRDDSSNISWLNDEGGVTEPDTSIVHNNCLESFGHFKNVLLLTWLPVDLGDIWWNMSDLLRIPSPLKHKRKAVLKNENEEKDVEGQKSTQSNLGSQSVKQDEVVVNKADSKQLLSVLNIFESLVMADTIYEKLIVDCDSEPAHTNRENRMVTNSLELNESMENYCSSRNLAYEWSRTLLDGYVNLYDVGESTIHHEDGSIAEGKRWRTKQNKCDEALSEAVPSVCHLDHNSVNMDYLSTLRTMARSEVVRASNNNKRRNRFYNYLRGVGVSCNDSLVQTACNTFEHEN